MSLDMLPVNVPQRSFRRMDLGEVYEGIPYFPNFALHDYLYELEEKGIAKPSLYVSMAITSGGYRRDETLDGGEVARKNTGYGDHLRTFFTDQGISPNEIVIPSELAAMRSAQWGQLDFLMLWFHIMAGVSEKNARLIENILRKSGAYRDGKRAQKEMLAGNREENWQLYEQLTRSYAEILKGIPHTPVEGVIGVLDTQESLGGNAEQLLAEILGIPYYTMEVQETLLRDDFRQEIETLTALGAQAIGTFAEQGPQIIFRPTSRQENTLQ